MTIRQMLFTPGASAFFFDDQQAIKQGAGHDGFVYRGAAVTPGFTAIRQAGEAISVQMLLADGQVACGDCAAVQYSGAGGRDPLFLAADCIPVLEQGARPRLLERGLTTFREDAAFVDTLRPQGRPLHTALRYGLTQALLDAHAKSRHRTMAEVILEEYDLPPIAGPVPVFGQSGDDRYGTVDKMILKQVAVLPHALINAIDGKLGRRGELLRDYVAWLAKRIRALRPDPAYQPALHIDVYGNIGRIFDHQPQAIAAYLAELEAAADGFALSIEGPVDMGERGAQIKALAAITAATRTIGCSVAIVADEWCNTFDDIRAFTDAACCDMVQIKTPDLGGVHHVVESVLYCRAHGMGAYQGGTCNETDVSARVCVHCALATGADRMLAKPGMGFDEGYQIVVNEMARALALIRARNDRGGTA